MFSMFTDQHHSSTQPNNFTMELIIDLCFKYHGPSIRIKLGMISYFVTNFLEKLEETADQINVKPPISYVKNVIKNGFVGLSLFCGRDAERRYPTEDDMQSRRVTPI